MKHSILIIDDNILEAEEMKNILEKDRIFDPDIFVDVNNIDIETDIYKVRDKIDKAFPQAPDKFPYRLIITDVFMPDPNEPESSPSEDHGGLMLHDFIKKKRAEINCSKCLKLMPRLIITSGQQRTIYTKAAEVIAGSADKNGRWAYVMPKPDATETKKKALCELLPKRVWTKIVEAGITSIQDELWLKGFLTGAVADLRGISVRIQEVRQAIQDRKGDYIVIVMGNTGTGKELIANALWEARGKKGNFHPLNLSELAGKATVTENFNAMFFGYTKEWAVNTQLTNPGNVEACGEKGTLWIDEAKVTLLQEINNAVLRFFDKDTREWKKVGSNDIQIFNGQIVLSSNDYDDNFDKLPNEMKGRLPSPDKWIRLPSINEIKEDIALLTEKIFTGAIETKLKDKPNAPQPVLSEGFLNTLNELVEQKRIKDIVDQNVRGLEKFVASIAENYKDLTNNDTMKIGSECLDQYIIGKPSRAVSVESLLTSAQQTPKAKLTKELLRESLTKNDGNRSKVEEELSWSRGTIIKYIAKFGLDKEFPSNPGTPRKK